MPNLWYNVKLCIAFKEVLMKNNFNGATKLSDLVALTAAQDKENSINASFLQRAEQKFGEKLGAPSAGYTAQVTL